MNFFKTPKVVLAIVLIIMAMGGIVIAKNLSAPAQGSVAQTPPSQAETIQPYGQPGAFRGKYVAFNFPAHFKPVPTKLSGNYLEVADYHATDESAKQINVGVTPGDINADSGVVYRRQHKELYRETDSKLGVEFTKLDGTEDTFFMGHGGLLASVAATAPYGGLAGEALYVASSLKWL